MSLNHVAGCRKPRDTRGTLSDMHSETYISLGFRAERGSSIPQSTRRAVASMIPLIERARVGAAAAGTVGPSLRGRAAAHRAARAHAGGDGRGSGSSTAAHVTEEAPLPTPVLTLRGGKRAKVSMMALGCPKNTVDGEARVSSQYTSRSAFFAVVHFLWRRRHRGPRPITGVSSGR